MEERIWSAIVEYGNICGPHSIANATRKEGVKETPGLCNAGVRVSSQLNHSKI